MNIHTLKWLNTCRTTPKSNQSNGCWDVVCMTKCTEWEPTHGLLVRSVVIDDQSVQVIDQDGVIWQGTRSKHESHCSISSNSTQRDIINIESCNARGAAFSITRISCDANQALTYSSAKYYARKRALTYKATAV